MIAGQATKKESRQTMHSGGGRVCSSIAALLLACYASSSSLLAAPVTGYAVVTTYPHSTSSYTEGLFYLNGLLYEGTGLEGQSALLAVQLRTGLPVRKRALPLPYFGEGIVDWGPYVYQWTWKSHTCFVYRRSDFALVKQMSYSGEGWGMTRTKNQIVTSDGSADLTFRDPETFVPVRKITVHDGTVKVDQLNELEFVEGELYANVWLSDKIARIDPADGHVIGWIDLSGILPANKRTNGDAVLNGIAYDPKKHRLFVTGKQWPLIFQIKIIARPAGTS